MLRLPQAAPRVSAPWEANAIWRREVCLDMAAMLLHLVMLRQSGRGRHPVPVWSMPLLSYSHTPEDAACRARSKPRCRGTAENRQPSGGLWQAKVLAGCRHSPARSPPLERHGQGASRGWRRRLARQAECVSESQTRARLTPRTRRGALALKQKRLAEERWRALGRGGRRPLRESRGGGAHGRDRG